MQDRVCELCGVEFIDGSYKFSYRPEQPVHKDAVYTRVCKSAIDAEKKRQDASETDLEPIALHKCINTTGTYDKRYRWLKPNEAV